MKGFTRAVLLGFAVLALAATMVGAPPPEPAAAVTDCSLTAPANISVSNNPNQAGAVVTYPAPGIAGTCNTVSCSPASGAFYPLGTTLVTCSASTSPVVRASFTIRVNDTQPPSIIVPPAKTVGNDPGKATALVTYTPPTASDNAPGVTVACVRPSNSLFALGTTNVSCTARDAAGNTATGSFNVIVNDTEAPVIELAPDVSATVPAAADGGPVEYAVPAAHDNSGTNPVVACDPVSGSTFGVGATTVTCSAADAAANTATKTFAVVVTRAAAPIDIDSAFTLGKPKLDRRKGTARLPITVPGPGTLSLAGEGVVAQRPDQRDTAAKPVLATVKLRVAATGEAKKTLQRTGRVTVDAVVTYTPTVGAPSSQTASVKLRKRG